MTYCQSYMFHWNANKIISFNFKFIECNVHIAITISTTARKLWKRPNEIPKLINMRSLWVDFCTFVCYFDRKHEWYERLKTRTHTTKPRHICMVLSACWSTGLKIILNVCTTLIKREKFDFQLGVVEWCVLLNVKMQQRMNSSLMRLIFVTDSSYRKPSTEANFHSYSYIKICLHFWFLSNGSIKCFSLANISRNVCAVHLFECFQLIFYLSIKWKFCVSKYTLLSTFMLVQALYTP